jgi:hypothetical protein
VAHLSLLVATPSGREQGAGGLPSRCAAGATRLLVSSGQKKKNKEEEKVKRLQAVSLAFLLRGLLRFG